MLKSLIHFILSSFFWKYKGKRREWAVFSSDLSDFAERRVPSLIGAKCGKTAAQTALRFLMQSGVVVILKSVHKERMQQNFDLFDFTLTSENMAKACSSRTTTPRRASGS